jgi:Domain of unknown function (DUF222)/HNH endonuclease
VFEDLINAIDKVPSPLCARDLEVLACAAQRLQLAMAVNVGVFEHECQWAFDGATSMTNWLTSRGYSNASSAMLIRVGKVVRVCPTVAKLADVGELTLGQVHTIAVAVGPHLTLFSEIEADLAPTLTHLSARETASVMEQWRAAADDVDSRMPDAFEARRLHLSRGLDGTVTLDAVMDSASGDIVKRALAVAETSNSEGETRTPAQTRHDALVDICQWFLLHANDEPTSRNRPVLELAVPLNDVKSHCAATTTEGGLFPAADLAATACDCTVHRVVVNPLGTILDYGRAARVVPNSLFRALVIRDKGCRHPGCDRPAAWCDAHHIIQWQHGGRTDLANMVLLCRRHHRLTHTTRWSLDYNVDTNTVTVQSPMARQWHDPPRTNAPPGRVTPIPNDHHG